MIRRVLCLGLILIAAAAGVQAGESYGSGVKVAECARID
jgi:hypothetical protein